VLLDVATYRCLHHHPDIRFARGVFLDAIKDPTNGLPDGGPGRWYGNSGTENNPSGVGLGNFVVSELTAAVSPGPPYMSDVVTNHSLTTLSGRAEADSTVSVFDGNKLLGTATADNFGDWSLQANIKGNPIHQFSETLTDAAGNSAASAGVTVYSPNQHQTLAGGAGNNFLIAGPNDTLIGGTGNDTFVFNANFGKDVINNFNTNHDVLAFSHTLFANDTVAQILSQTHDTSAGAVIAVDAHDSITLYGVTMAQLAAHPSDFHFF